MQVKYRVCRVRVFGILLTSFASLERVEVMSLVVVVFVVAIVPLDFHVFDLLNNWTFCFSKREIRSRRNKRGIFN